MSLQPDLDPVRPPAALSAPAKQEANNDAQLEDVDSVVDNGDVSGHPPVEQLTNGQLTLRVSVTTRPVLRSRLPVQVHFPAPSFLGIPEKDAEGARGLLVQHRSQSSISPRGGVASPLSLSATVVDFHRFNVSNAGLFKEEDELRQHLMNVPEEETQFSSSNSQVVAGQQARNTVNSNVADNRELINAIVSTLNTVRDVTLNLLFEIEGISDSVVMPKLYDALKDSARESVKDLFITGNSARRVMLTLQTRFGNPLVVGEKIVSDLKSLPSLESGKIEFYEFLSSMSNAVTALKSLANFELLCSNDLMQCILSKLPPVLTRLIPRDPIFDLFFHALFFHESIVKLM
ncbi:hypothetical protein TKK_0014497 [Trichogramma kaykai]